MEHSAFIGTAMGFSPKSFKTVLWAKARTVRVSLIASAINDGVSQEAICRII